MREETFVLDEDKPHMDAAFTWEPPPASEWWTSHGIGIFGHGSSLWMRDLLVRAEPGKQRGDII